MAKGVNIKVQGLAELKKKFKQLPDNVREEVDVIMESAARNFENRAAQAAPIDFGNLKTMITYDRLGEMKYEVVSAANYSAYLEFGTINHVNVPADLANYAAQFKGKGLKKNGGIIARPFFFIQRQPVFNQLQKDLEPAIKKALNK